LLEQLDTSVYEGLDFFLQSVLVADELKPCPLCPVEAFFGQQWILTVDAVNYGEKTPEQAARDTENNCNAELDRILAIMKRDQS